MDLEDSLRRVVGRWKDAFGRYDALRRAAEPAAVRWEWADGERHSLLPFHFKRYPGRGRAMKAPPTSRGYYTRYGFDERERLRLHHDYHYLDLDGGERLERHRANGFAVDDDVSETFYSYSEDLVEIVQFSIRPGLRLPRIPLKVERIAYQDGRVVSHTSLRLNGYTPLYSQKGKDPEALYAWLGPNGRFAQAEAYVYDGDRLVKILLYHEVPGLSPYRAEDLFTYDEAGALSRIERVHRDGQRRLLYRKREKGQTYRALCQAAQQKMVEAIVERLREEEIGETLYCIELSYQAVSQYYPPLIVLGLERDRQRLLDSGARDAGQSVFCPGLWGEMRWLEITDPDVLEICAQLEQEIQAGSRWQAATRILRAVAADLTRRNWTGILAVTSDFVVYAIDWEMEGDHLAEVLGASVPKAQIRAWREKGWV